MSKALSSLLPFLVIFPSLVLPPELNCLGTRPHHADNCLPFENCFPEPTWLKNAAVTIGPKPGIASKA